MPKKTKPLIRWTAIREQDAYGCSAELGNRSVEVLRAYSNDWRVFGGIDGLTCKFVCGEPQVWLTMAAAKGYAARFLRGEFTPDTWPKREGDAQ